MKKFLVLFLGVILGAAFSVSAAPVSWDYTSGILRPLQSMWSSEVRVPYITATSTTATSSIAGHFTVTGNTRLATSLTGLLKGTSGAISAATAGTDYVATTSGDWTGTIDGNNFAGGAIGAGQLLYGASAGSITELSLGASSTILSNNGTIPLWATPSSLCVSITGSAALCDGDDASGSGGSGISTSSTPTPGNLAFWTSASALSSVATGTLTETVTGLQFDATRGLVGGAAILSLTSGYEVPLTASTTNWQTAYTNSHAAVTLSGALDYITLVGQDIVRGVIDLATDVGSTVLGIANGGLGQAYTDPNADQLMFWDDSVGAIKSIATLAGAAISGTTLTINDVTCTDCLTLTEIADEYLFNNGDVGTGVYDFGGATSFEIPNGAAPTVDLTGELAFDTTDNQLVIANSNNASRAIRTEGRIFGFTLASTSPEFRSGGEVPVPLEKDGYIVTAIRCYVQGGTSVQMTLTDNTNAMDTLTCATTATSDDGSIANNTVTAAELMYVDVGTISGTPDYVTFAAFGYYIVE